MLRITATSVVILFSVTLAAAAAPRPTLQESVAARTELERVYDSHRIWPTDNAAAKPRFEDAVPAAAIRARVEETWRMAGALRRFWSIEITGPMLQAELNRMAASTRSPELLQEIFDALGNDAARIAEALARPALVDRLVREAFARDARLTGSSTTRSFDAWWSEARSGFALEPPASLDGLILPAIGGIPCTPGTWTPTGPQGPRPVWGATAVWTGSEMIAWGGAPGPEGFGARRYDPATDTWSSISAVNEPLARSGHRAVWTGSVMVVWGGHENFPASTKLNTGGRYDPASDTWTATSTGANVPTARDGHSAVWSGSRIVVWGGVDQSAASLNTGGRYDPVADTWTSTSTGVRNPAARSAHAAVWTGSVMIVWGGLLGTGTSTNTGGRYDPVADSWDTTRTSGSPGGRQAPTMVWTGTQAILWGGYDAAGQPIGTGSRYDPAADTWAATSIGANVPAARREHTAVWTGSRMVIWGGRTQAAEIASGARYDPATDTWAATSAIGAPTARTDHVAVWTGSKMVVWSGRIAGGSQSFDSGGRYDPATDVWVPTATDPAGPPRAAHTSVWTGAEMIVFGGFGSFTSPTPNLADGRRYDPASNAWTTASTAGAPSARQGHAAIWTGGAMIVWGGLGNTGVPFGDGARYDPATDAWSAVAAAGAPSARGNHKAIWTGSRMIVWGGSNDSTGGRYDPAANAWSPTSTGANVPSPRSGHTAVWTGREMIVWGGGNNNTGARYRPDTDSWTAMAVGNPAPGARTEHTAVWTGSKMIVWGGAAIGIPLNTGGAYDLATNTWAATVVDAGTPSVRNRHSAIWTGSEMVVWGGTNNGTRSDNGGRYNAAANTWSPLPAGGGSPQPRSDHAAVWTGDRMIVWAGSDFQGLRRSGGAYCVASCAQPSVFYPDADGDGFGANGISVLACATPPGHASVAGDCDDLHANANPGAVESCDGLDNNCDGVVDDGFPTAGSPVLVEGRTGAMVDLSWSAAGGVEFHVIYGSLEFLRSFSNFEFTCHQSIVSNFAGTSLSVSQSAPFGHPTYFLVHGESCAGVAGSYSSGAASERPGRDAEIAIPHGSCP